MCQYSSPCTMLPILTGNYHSSDWQHWLLILWRWLRGWSCSISVHWLIHHWTAFSFHISSISVWMMQGSAVYAVWGLLVTLCGLCAVTLFQCIQHYLASSERKAMWWMHEPAMKIAEKGMSNTRASQETVGFPFQLSHYKHLLKTQVMRPAEILAYFIYLTCISVHLFRDLNGVNQRIRNTVWPLMVADEAIWNIMSNITHP